MVVTEVDGGGGVPTDNVINARYCNTCPIM